MILHAVSDPYHAGVELLPTFKEQQELLTSTQHSLAVWEALFRFLDEKFVAHEGGKPQMAISAHDCLVPVVPEDVIEDVLRSLSQEKIIPLKKTLQDINEQEMVVMPINGEN